MDGVPGSEAIPLQWAVHAMYVAVERFRATGWNLPREAFAAMGESLWWIGVVSEHLTEHYWSDYEATLAEEPGPMQQLLDGFKFVRNRITHEVDEVGYISARAKNPSSFEAHWTWQSLPPRPDARRNVGRADYEAEVTGHDVVETLLRASVFLGSAVNRMWSNYGQDTKS
jgi:hypothetical protein